MGSQSLQVRPVCRAVRMGGSDSPLQPLPRPQPESFPKGRGDIQLLDVDTSMGFGSLGEMEIEPNQVMQTGYTCPPISLLSSESKTRWWATDAPHAVPLPPCFRKPVQLWRATSDRVGLRATRTGSFLSLRTSTSHLPPPSDAGEHGLRLQCLPDPMPRLHLMSSEQFYAQTLLVPILKSTCEAVSNHSIA